MGIHKTKLAMASEIATGEDGDVCTVEMLFYNPREWAKGSDDWIGRHRCFGGGNLNLSWNKHQETGERLRGKPRISTQGYSGNFE